LIDDQFLTSIGRTTDSGFAQTEVLANLRCRQAQISNRQVGQNTTGTYPIGLFSGDNHFGFYGTLLDMLVNCFAIKEKGSMFNPW
jgi:hypothetical protein